VRRIFEDFATGHFTQQQLLAQVRRTGLTTRKGLPLSSQAFGTLLQNPLYIGIIDVPDYGVRWKRGDFEPLIGEDVFYRVQAVLSGRVQPTAPRQRSRPDFPLRGFVRCSVCGRGLTGSWSKGRHGGRYAYYHCRSSCRAVNIAKAQLEGLFVDELERLQPTPGYMRLLKESILTVWHERKSAVRHELEDVERKAKAIQQKLDRLDEAFIFARAIDSETYERQRDRLREELTLIQIDRHTTELEELDVEGILAFAERVLPRASELWVHASLDRRQRLQQLFFPEGVPFDGKGFSRTLVNAAAFSYLRPIRQRDENVVGQSRVESLQRDESLSVLSPARSARGS
jgi:site-specific DNA recombinase